MLQLLPRTFKFLLKNRKNRKKTIVSKLSSCSSINNGSFISNNGYFILYNKHIFLHESFCPTIQRLLIKPNIFSWEIFAQATIVSTQSLSSPFLCSFTFFLISWNTNSATFNSGEYIGKKYRWTYASCKASTISLYAFFPTWTAALSN